MPIPEQTAQAVTRRHFLGRTSVGIGAMALSAMLDREGQGAQDRSGLLPKPPTFSPRAKNVIYLHMAGSPSQLELFDYKPELKKRSGQACPDEILKGERFAFIRGVPNMLGTPFQFKQYGQSGAWVSELLPHFSEVVDDVAVIQSMVTDQFNHSPAQLYLLTGSPRFGGASMGGWATYGLGTENQDLPGYVVMVSGGKTPSAGKSLWGSGFLPSIHQGVQCRSTGDPVLYVSNPSGMDRAGRRQMLDTVRALNEHQAQWTGDPETVTRIAQYELAFRMQISVPQVMDISQEPKHILDLYGARPGHVSNVEGVTDPRKVTQGNDAAFANNCLLARRLVERGVRFVQLFDWGWDHHGVSEGEDIDHHLPIKCQQVDRAIAGLIKDLKQRGLLDETLVVWGGEFGRTPMRQNAGAKYLGRDHHRHAFTIWMAGGGIRGGQTYGATDELGYNIVRDPMDVRDLQATILHLLGLDPWKLTYRFQGLNQRLIGPEGEARLHPRLLA